MAKLPYERFILPNGLTVLLYPMPAVYTTFATLYVKVGAIYEKEKDRGLSHFTEHVAFQGTEKYPSPGEISRAQASLGAYLNAFTDRFKTSYIVRSAYTEFEKSLLLLEQVVFHPLAEKKQVEREREVALAEYNDLWQKPENRFGITFWRKRFAEKEHPYSYLVIGRPENLAGFTRKDVLRWRERYYSPGNMILSLAGRFEPEKLKKFLLKNFAEDKEDKRVKSPKFDPDGYSGFTLYHFPEKRDQITFALSFPAFGWKQYPRKREEFTAYLLRRILGVGPASRLFTRLREEEKLVYQIGANNLFYPWRGVLEISGSVAKEKLVAALAAIREELDKMVEKEVSQGELPSAKKAYSVSTLMKFDRPEDIAFYFADEEFDEQGIWLPEKYITAAEKVTAKNVHKMAENIFDYKRANIGLFGDVGAKERKRIEQIWEKFSI